MISLFCARYCFVILEQLGVALSTKITILPNLYLLSRSENSFNQKKFLIIMICIVVVVVVIDTSIVKVYDLRNKGFFSEQSKIILFSINAIICLLLEFILLKYIRTKLKEHKLSKSLNLNLIYRISLFLLLFVGFLISLLIFQQFSNNYYNVSISISIIIISYGTAIFFISRLSILFHGIK